MRTRRIVSAAFACALSALATTGAQAVSSIEEHEYFRSGERLTSANGKYFAAIQNDGNFCVYPTSGGGPRFCAHNQARAQGPYYGVMQRDGNFCVYSGTGPAVGKTPALSWCSMSRRDEGSEYRVFMQDDGNFAIYGVSPGASGPKLVHVWSTVAGNDSKNAHGGSVPISKYRFSCPGRLRDEVIGLNGFMSTLSSKSAKLSPADKTRFDALGQQLRQERDVLSLPQHYLDTTLEARCQTLLAKAQRANADLRAK